MLFNQEKHSKFPQLEENNNNKEEEEEEEKEGGLIDLTNKSIILITKYDFISDDKGETYNLCHFWSNFEIANLNFWRGEAYRKYFDYLDQTGGFFYERWGDAPIHSIAAALFLPKDKIHYFDDVEIGRAHV